MSEIARERESERARERESEQASERADESAREKNEASRGDGLDNPAVRGASAPAADGRRGAKTERRDARANRAARACPTRDAVGKTQLLSTTACARALREDATTTRVCDVTNVFIFVTSHVRRAPMYLDRAAGHALRDQPRRPVGRRVLGGAVAGGGRVRRALQHRRPPSRAAVVGGCLPDQARPRLELLRGAGWRHGAGAPRQRRLQRGRPWSLLGPRDGPRGPRGAERRGDRRLLLEDVAGVEDAEEGLAVLQQQRPDARWELPGPLHAAPVAALRVAVRAQRVENRGRGPPVAPLQIRRSKMD